MLFHFLNYGPPSAVHMTDILFRLLPLMDMFFMISGFLIMERYADRLVAERGSYARFLIRRVARFYPLYLATLAFFVAVALAVRFGVYDTQSPERYDLAALPANLLLIQGWGFTDTLTFNYVGWTLSAEWFCYLTLPVIVLAHRRFGLAGLAFIIAASFIALEVATVAGLVPFERWFFADTWGAFRAFADFAIGALVAMTVRRGYLRVDSHWPAWLCFVASLLAMMWISASYLVLGLLALSVLLAATAERRNPEGSRLLFVFDPLGRVSFSIYLIHPVVAALVLGGVWRMFVEPTGLISFYVFWFLPMVAVIAASLASYHWFETPAARWINSVFAGADGSRPVAGPARTAAGFYAGPEAR
jgi:peptidoglycan/LPS O-acetylase OafA/YrhL